MSVCACVRAPDCAGMRARFTFRYGFKAARGRVRVPGMEFECNLLFTFVANTIIFCDLFMAHSGVQKKI